VSAASSPGSPRTCPAPARRAARSPSPTGPSRTARGRGSATRPTTWTTCPRARPWWSTMRAAPPARTGGAC
jgi:hypothetical protein